ICILAFLIEKIIERFTNGSAESIIDELKRVRISEINMGSLKTKIITEYSKETEDIFKKLKIESPSLNLIRN
ncbi:MAG: hypothetical protein K0B07_05000, partial [DPANN group archaeon]|nr:hypothetical protein [DPANN group archaeon]